MTVNLLSSETSYNRWQSVTETVRGHACKVATKPGVFSHGRHDPAALLLAEHAAVKTGDVAVHMNCGNGLFGTIAATTAARVYCTDRHYVSYLAAQRTLALNHVMNADVLLAGSQISRFLVLRICVARPRATRCGGYSHSA